jgi:hypothetical protein
MEQRAEHPLAQRLLLTVTDERPTLATTLEVAGVAAPGGQVVIKGAGCRPGTAVALTLDGGVALATATAAEQGEFVVAATVPAGATVGDHQVVATCAGPDGSIVEFKAPLTVIGATGPIDTTPPGK